MDTSFQENKHQGLYLCLLKSKSAFFIPDLLKVKSNVDDTTENRTFLLYVVDGMYEVSERCRIEAKENFKAALSDFLFTCGAETNTQKHNPDLQSDYQTVMAHLSATNCLHKHPADTQESNFRPPDKFNAALFTFS